MDSIQKLNSDILKAKKHHLAENNGAINLQKLCDEIIKLFVSSNRGIEGLARSFADYWANKYVLSNPDGELSEKSINVLLSIQALFENEVSLTDSLDAEDWKELCELTNYEAEDLPLEFLNNLMIIFVDRKSL